jgi:Flp pilus assembly protein TadB
MATDPHHVEALFNAGWDDDPEWQIICSCEWEAWNQPTKLAAREAHAEHRAELLLTGRRGGAAVRGPGTFLLCVGVALMALATRALWPTPGISWLAGVAFGAALTTYIFATVRAARAAGGEDTPK